MIVRLTGGLANQLFMYAFGRSLSAQRHEPVKFHWSRSTWDYALGNFNARVDLVNPPIYNPVYEEKTFAFDKDVYTTPRDTYFRGYWQTEKYFHDAEQLRKEITLRSIRPEVANRAAELQQENSVFIHIRRGDYLNPGTEAVHGNLGHRGPQESYYKAAIEYVIGKVKDPKFYVFSDDPQWCLENFWFDVVSVGDFKNYEELYIMSRCRHGIGANSTFSWWANWLGEYPGRVCVAPLKWFNNDLDTKDIIPERWVRL